ncbi:MAG: TolC family protein [Gemmatimonadaceae bacterium]
MYRVLNPANWRGALAVMFVAALPLDPALAQSGDSTSRRLTLGQVYQWAMDAVPAVEAAMARARAADNRVTAASRPEDPMVTLGLMNRELPRLGPMRPLNMTQLQVTQMFPLPGKLRLSGAIARETASALHERARGRQLEIRAAAASAFFELYVVDQSLALTHESEALWRDIREAARTMYGAGRGRLADVLRADVEIGRTHEAVIRLQAQHHQAISQLSALLNRSIDTALVAAMPVLPDSVPVLEALLRESVDEHADLRSARADLRAANDATQLAQRELWPDVEVSLQYGQRPGEVGMGTERMASLMVGARVPIFARSRQLRMREEALAMRQMANAELQTVTAETKQRVTVAHGELVQARRLLELYSTSLVPTAQAAREAALTSYRAGGTEFMAVLDSHAAFIELRRSVTEAQVMEGRALAELEALVGHDLIAPKGSVSKNSDPEAGR